MPGTGASSSLVCGSLIGWLLLKGSLASGDCRNLIKTITSLPHSYEGSFEVILNDRDMDIVARNALLLLTAFWFDPETATPTIIHLWYSAFLPESILAALQKKFLPMIRGICAKIESKSSTNLQRKTWSNGSRSLCLALRKASWKTLLSHLRVPDGLAVAQAKEIRAAVTLALDRRDYLDRALFRQPPGKRVAMILFREDGILLPFGSSRADFNSPNPCVYLAPVRTCYN